MITRVNSVLVANAACPASYTDEAALNAGEVALFDENGKIIKDEETAAKAKQIRIGVCKGIMKVVNPTSKALEDKKQFEFSTFVQKDSILNKLVQAYVAPIQEKIEFNLASANIVIGHRYVLRIVYKDLFEHPGQFTHTYEVTATSTAAQDLCDAFAKAINQHPNKRVAVASASNKITLTALEKDDNEGVNSINEYSVVSMDATLYYTIPGALLSNIPTSVPGVTKTITEGNPGKGYWKQVRDLEMRNMGYKGMVFTDAYPAIVQEKNVNPANTYDYMIIENDNTYLSPDNQYTKKTPLTISLFVKAGSLSTSLFNKMVDAFINGKAAEA